MLLNHVEILSNRLRQTPIQLDHAQDIFTNFTDEITTYMYPKSAHHNSYGMEAMDAIVDWAKQNINFEYIMYPVDKRNFASRRIPEKHHGTIQEEYKHINLSGNELDIVEYWIYK